MFEAPMNDLVRIDADVRRLAERLARESDSLATEEGREKARSADPFWDLRHVAGKTLYDALAERTAEHEVLHRDGLLRWVHELLQARIGRDLAIEDAARRHAPSETASRAEKRRVLSIDASTSTPEASADAAGETYVAAFRAVLTSEDRVRGALALERASSLAAPVAAVRRERRARRFEAARRLGLAHPSALVLPAEAAAQDPSGAGLARTVLELTEPLASALHKEAQKRAGGGLLAVDTLASALAREAQDGWPAHLGARWLEGVFSGACPRPVRVARLPSPLGGASFLRAAAVFGAALREQGTARSLPFSLARDPYATGAHRFGALFALGLADPVLQEKALGVSRRTAVAQARILRRSAFLGLRVLAARVLLGESESVDPGAFEEITLRVFGAPLPAALRDAWPEARPDDLARLAAACEAKASLDDLVTRFDEDWFRNPRSGAHLGSVACGPVAEPLAPKRELLTALARACEEALG